jgi:hypothetical protein
MEGSITLTDAALEAERAFWRKMTLRYIMAHAPVQQERDKLKLTMKRLGIVVCYKCGEHQLPSDTRPFQGCVCERTASRIEWICNSCWNKEAVFHCIVCFNGHSLCDAHAVSVGCSVVPNCNSKMLPACEQFVTTCCVCDKRMCRYHRAQSGPNACENCVDTLRECEAKQMSQARKNAKRQARRMVNMRTTKKTKQ